jgi:hypothetical protein
MIYMLTATEIVFIKDIIEQLATISEPSEYVKGEVTLALELLNKIEPVDTEKVLELFEDPEELTPEEV